MTIVDNMPAEEYHAMPSVSSSQLATLWKSSPAHLRYNLDHGQKDTAALSFGRAFHTLLLEPHLWNNEVAVAPNVDRRTAKGKEEYAGFLESSTGKTIISTQENGIARAMTKALRDTPSTKEILDGKGKRECSLFWTDATTKLECRARFDWLRSDGLIVDVKTAKTAKPTIFRSEAINYGYHLRAFHYMEAYRHTFYKDPEGYVFVVVEKEAPHVCAAYYADQDFIDFGEHCWRETMGQYAECKRTNTWKGYTEFIEPLGVPAWVTRTLENQGEPLWAN